jgi:hypothetical protein
MADARLRSWDRDGFSSLDLIFGFGTNESTLGSRLPSGFASSVKTRGDSRDESRAGARHAPAAHGGDFR